jgi:hypothetical protein
MAVRLPKSIYIHLMKTGGWSVRDALNQMRLNCGEIGRGHDPASLLPLPAKNRPFTFVFIRHPLSWYRSYWAYRMQAAWQVHPKQPITGWQTFGAVLDHECRADDFETWMRNVLAYVPEGFLSRIYRIYTEGVDFVGKIESFQDDFCRALTLAGEKFSPKIIQSLPRRNITSARFTAAATLPKLLAEKVMATESYVIKRWGYNSIPPFVICSAAGKAVQMETDIERHQKMLDRVVKSDFPKPKGLRGRGIVICGGGKKYFPGAWVGIKMLRHLGCTLPIQVWHLGEAEMSRKMKKLLTPLEVRTVDALKLRVKYPARILNGWELKPYAIIHSPYREVLLIDADNVPVRNPEYLFEASQFRQTGAVFWPDRGRLATDRSIWKICGVNYRNEPEFESGQVLIDKARCWKALQIAMHLNEHSDYYYRHMFGDKETFHMAFRRLGQEYAMPNKGVQKLDATICQYDFDGRILFQHRYRAKWRLEAPNKRIKGFKFERQCLAALAELRKLSSVEL